MRDKPEDYKQFADRIFREIEDLEAEGNTERRKHPLQSFLREYGLTMADASRRYYKKGMTVEQFIDAIMTDRDK